MWSRVHSCIIFYFRGRFSNSRLSRKRHEILTKNHEFRCFLLHLAKIMKKWILKIRDDFEHFKVPTKVKNNAASEADYRGLKAPNPTFQSNVVAAP